MYVCMYVCMYVYIYIYIYIYHADIAGFFYVKWVVKQKVLFMTTMRETVNSKRKTSIKIHNKLMYT